MAATEAVVLIAGPFLVAFLLKRDRFGVGTCARLGAVVPLLVVGGLQAAAGLATRAGGWRIGTALAVLVLVALGLARRHVAWPLRAVAGRIWSIVPVLTVGVLALMLTATVVLAAVGSVPGRQPLETVLFGCLIYALIAVSGMATATAVWVIAHAGRRAPS